MNKCLHFTNYRTFRNELKQMRSDLKQRELDIKADAKSYVFNLPKKVISKTINPQNAIVKSNPIGKLLATTVTHTVLKKEGFLVKLIAKIMLRKFGKKLTRNLLHT